MEHGGRGHTCRTARSAPAGRKQTPGTNLTSLLACEDLSLLGLIFPDGFAGVVSLSIKSVAKGALEATWEKTRHFQESKGTLPSTQAKHRRRSPPLAAGHGPGEGTAQGPEVRGTETLGGPEGDPHPKLSAQTQKTRSMAQVSPEDATLSPTAEVQANRQAQLESRYHQLTALRSTTSQTHPNKC